MDPVTVRRLNDGDRSGWEELWSGYQRFYETLIPADVTELTWKRFLNPAEPLIALGAFSREKLLGIAHAIFHPSCWTESPYCYLQDLFVSPEAREQGVGRLLIEAVFEVARDSGASQVYWLTHRTNASAISLYDKVAERSGFVEYSKKLV